jgi:hypothetical protein
MAQRVRRLRADPIALMLVCLAVLGACTARTPFAGLVEARRLAADLQIEFTRAADAANRAVMADTDETSVAYAREATAALDAVQKNADSLTAVLTESGFSQEADQLREFRTRFAEYRTLDRTILDLAVENTNLKAQRLSFGEARKAADAFQDALNTVASANVRDPWRVKALASTALARVRQIEALQAPHIAEADDAAMTALETQMTTAANEARRALDDLNEGTTPASRPGLAAARTELDRFMQLNAQIVTLSRRNTNVRSLALSLNQKRMAAAACEASLQTLRDALARRTFAGTR